MPTPHTSHQTAAAEADDRRADEAAKEQEEELKEAQEEVLVEEEAAPESGVQESRRGIDVTLSGAEEKEGLSFEEATAGISNITDLDAMDEYFAACQDARLVWIQRRGKILIARPIKTKSKRAESKKLCTALNRKRKNLYYEGKPGESDKRSEESEQPVAPSRKPKRTRKVKGRESKILTEKEVFDAAVEKINSFTDYLELEMFVFQKLVKNRLLKKDLREDYTVTPVEDFEYSAELCEAVMAKKTELMPAYLAAKAEAQEAERKQRRLTAAFGDIAEKSR